MSGYKVREDASVIFWAVVAIVTFALAASLRETELKNQPPSKTTLCSKIVTADFQLRSYPFPSRTLLTLENDHKVFLEGFRKEYEDKLGQDYCYGNNKDIQEKSGQ